MCQLSVKKLLLQEDIFVAMMEPRAERWQFAGAGIFSAYWNVFELEPAPNIPVR